jgi:hypothetical protein
MPVAAVVALVMVVVLAVQVVAVPVMAQIMVGLILVAGAEAVEKVPAAMVVQEL